MTCRTAVDRAAAPRPPVERFEFLAGGEVLARRGDSDLVWRTTDQGVTWTVSQRPPFVHHQVDFLMPSPMGFARCGVCGDYVTAAQWAAWQCRGIPHAATFAPVLPGEVPCSLCALPVSVAPEHRDHVRMFGATCESCFNLTPTEGAHA